MPGPLPLHTGAIGRATLTRKHIAGDHTARRRVRALEPAGGRVLTGLVRRRAAEAALYRRRAGRV